MKNVESLPPLSNEQLLFVRGEINRLRPEVVNSGKVIDALPLPTPGEQAYGADYSVLTMEDKSFVLAYHNNGEQLVKTESVKNVERIVPYQIKVAAVDNCPNDGSSTEKIVSYDLNREVAHCEFCNRDSIALSPDPVTKTISQPQMMTGEMTRLPLAAQGTSDEVLAKMVGDFANTDATKLTQLLQAVGMKDLSEMQVKTFMGVAQGLIAMPEFSVSKWLKEEAREGWQKVGAYLPESIRSQVELVLGMLDQYQEDDHIKIYGPVPQNEVGSVFVVRGNQLPLPIAEEKKPKMVEVGKVISEIKEGDLHINALDIRVINGKASYSYSSHELKEAVKLTTTRNSSSGDRRNVILWENVVEQNISQGKKKLFSCKVDAGQVGCGSIARLWFKYADGIREPLMTNIAESMRKKGYEVEQGIVESKPTRDSNGKATKDPTASVTWVIKGKHGFHYRMGQPTLLISSNIAGSVKGTRNENELFGNEEQLNEFLQISCKMIEVVCESVALQI